MICNYLTMRYLKILFFLSAIIFCSCSSVKKANLPTNGTQNNDAAATSATTFLPHLLAGYPTLFDSVLKNNSKYHVQIVYTKIDRKENGNPVLTSYYYNAADPQYFYPASTVKLPVSLLALQRLNELKVPGLDKHTTMITGAGFKNQTEVYNDATTEDGRPTIAHYIKRILLASDNDAYNRLYEFLGQEYINNTLHKMGYDSAQIVHRLNVVLTEEQNRYTNPVSFYDTAAHLIYSQPLRKSNLTYQKCNSFLGRGFYSGDVLIEEPFDFSKKNKLALTDLHSILTSVVFPDEVTKKQRFNLTQDDYRFLYSQMALVPKESKFPSYDSTYNDAYVKFLFYGGKDPVNNDIHIFNKVGDAYGFLTDAAYIMDAKSGVEFLLSATIYCNSDGIFNDDKYDYETIGLPFLKNLGQVIYQYELKRERKVKPDFSRFLLNK